MNASSCVITIFSLIAPSLTYYQLSMFPRPESCNTTLLLTIQLHRNLIIKFNYLIGTATVSFRYTCIECELSFECLIGPSSESEILEYWALLLLTLAVNLMRKTFKFYLLNSHFLDTKVENSLLRTDATMIL